MNSPLIIMGSARRSGNTKFVIDRFLADIPHERLDLLDADIRPYSYDGARSDDFMLIARRMQESHDVVFATPVYWYAMSGIMKTFFDRLTDLITRDKPMGRALAGKRTWLVANGTGPALPSGFEVPFALTSRYFNMVYGGGVYFQFDRDGSVLSYPADSLRYLVQVIGEA